MWSLGRAFVRVAIQHRAASAFFATATWGLLVLASFAGWGAAINVALFPRHRADWGMRCAWGWAAALAIGGVLCAASLAKRGELISIVAIGLVLLFAQAVRAYLQWSQRSSWRRERAALAETPFAIGVVAVFSLGILQYLASIQPGVINGNDDSACYFGFAREMLDRGTLTQPFSLRRMSAYGGKALLDAFQLAIPVPTGHLRAVDGGMAVLTVMALIVGHVRTSRWTARAIVLLLLLLVVSLPEIRFNTATTMTGVVFFLAAYRTLAWPPIQQTGGWRSAIPVALLAAGACTLRQNYLVPMAVFLGLEYGRSMVVATQSRPLRIATRASIDALATLALVVLFLGPWWATSQRWCRTFLYPLMKGNFNGDYPLSVPLKPFEALHYLWSNATYCLPVKAVPLFLVAALTMSDRAARKTLVSFVVAAFAGFVALVKTVPESDAENLGRYYFGFTFAALVAIALAAADAAAHSGGSARWRAQRVAVVPLVLSGIALQLYGDRGEMSRQYDGYLTTLQSQSDRAGNWEPPPRDVKYAELQDAVPAGAPIAVMVDDPSRFDFARNAIASLDVVGAVSPQRPLPLFQGAEAVAEYLVAQGYRYAIVVQSDTAESLYRRDKWKEHAARGIPIWKRTAPFYLAAFDVFDELRATHVHYADVGSMTTIGLSKHKE
jgi:hypothetical protein